MNNPYIDVLRVRYKQKARLRGQNLHRLVQAQRTTIVLIVLPVVAATIATIATSPPEAAGSLMFVLITPVATACDTLRQMAKRKRKWPGCPQLSPTSKARLKAAF